MVRYVSERKTAGTSNLDDEIKRLMTRVSVMITPNQEAGRVPTGVLPIVTRSRTLKNLEP